MASETIEQIEKQIKQAKELVEFGNAVERLKANRDFKKVVLEAYFKDEAVRLVHLKADPAFQTPQKQASLLSAMDAIGNLHMYLHDAVQCGQRAAVEIENSEAEIDVITAEEAQEAREQANG